MSLLKFGLDLAISRVARDVKNPVVYEFGVASGITYAWIAGVLAARLPRCYLVGFDSFQGLPEETEGVWRHGWHCKGEHAYGIEHVQQRLKEKNLERPEFKLFSGFYEESLKRHDVMEDRSNYDSLLLVNIDVDLHRSTLELLDFVKPLLKPGTLLYFDDWKDPTHKGVGEWGEHRAWREWTEENPIDWITVKIGGANERILEIV